MSYQPFSRADRKRWRRGERPRASLWMSEWWSARFDDWARRNRSRSWRRLGWRGLSGGNAANWRTRLVSYWVGAP